MMAYKVEIVLWVEDDEIEASLRLAEAIRASDVNIVGDILSEEF